MDVRALKYCLTPAHRTRRTVAYTGTVLRTVRTQGGWTVRSIKVGGAPCHALLLLFALQVLYIHTNGERWTYAIVRRKQYWASSRWLRSGRAW